MAEFGISLADKMKPEKAFAPTVRGEILGIWYDREKWTQNIDDRRWSVIGNPLGGSCFL